MAGLQDLLSWMDNKRRVVGRNLSDLVQNPSDYLSMTADNTLQTVRELPDDPANFLGAGVMKVIGPQSAALRLAQQRAALPVEQNGLGLAADNTPQMRSDAMGAIDAYHGTTANNIKKMKLPNDAHLTTSPDAVGIWAAQNPELANRVAQIRAEEAYYRKPMMRNYPPETVYPLKIMPGNEMQIPTRASMENMVPAGGTTQDLRSSLNGVDSLRVADDFGSGTSHVMLNPNDIRSRFAAFDPWRRNAAIAAAMGVAAPDLLAAEYQRRPMSDLMNPRID